MFAYAKLIGAAFLLIAGISIGYGIADMTKIKPLKAEVAKLSAQLESVISANQKNAETMEQIKKERDRVTISYEARLKLKEKQCKEILDICNLPASTATTIQGGVTNVQSTDNTLLNRLNSLYP